MKTNQPIRKARKSYPKCPRCGRVMRGEFVIARCRNTVACNRAAERDIS